MDDHDQNPDSGAEHDDSHDARIRSLSRLTKPDLAQRLAREEADADEQLQDLKRTMAELESTRQERDEATLEAEDVRNHIRQMDAEAKVIAACVDALDLIPGKPRTTSMYGFGYEQNDGSHHQSITRILDYLRGRYGIATDEQLRSDLRRTREELERSTATLEQLRMTIRGESDLG